MGSRNLVLVSSFSLEGSQALPSPKRGLMDEETQGLSDIYVVLV